MSGAYRVTERSIATSVMAGLQGNLTRIGTTQNKLATGKEVQRPSDSPTGTVSAMQFRSGIATVKQYARNADDGTAWLNAADSALTTISSQLNRTSDLVLQSVSNGVGGEAQARDAIAAEIDQIRKSVIGTANTQYLGRPIFGGTTSGTSAYGDDGGYLGDDGQVLRTVGENAKVRVDTPGPEVFGSDSEQIFSILSDISDHLTNNPELLSDDLDRLNAAKGTLLSGLSRVGARTDQVEEMQIAANAKMDAMADQLSEVENIDLAKTITDLSLQQTAYQAALAAAAKVVQPSLVDFLR
jgi:flagellar hook-associated protein 3 FlgL